MNAVFNIIYLKYSYFNKIKFLYTFLIIYIKIVKKITIWYNLKKIEILFFNLIVIFNNIIKFLQSVTPSTVNNYNIKLVNSILKITNHFKAL